MKLAEIAVEIRADMTRLRGDLERTRGQLTSWARGTVGALGAYFGARQMFRFISESYMTYAEAQEITAKLGGALRGIGVNAQLALPELIRFANEIQNATTYSDETVRSLMTLGASLGKVAGDDLKRMTVAAIGWAEALGVDATSAMNMLGRAAQGNFALWSRYTAELNKFSTAQEKMNYLLTQGAKHFEIAKDRAQSLGGSIKQLQNAWADAKEEFGRGLAEGFGQPGTGGRALLGELGRVMGEYARGAGTIVSWLTGTETPAEARLRQGQERIADIRRAAERMRAQGLAGRAGELEVMAAQFEEEIKRPAHVSTGERILGFLTPGLSFVRMAGKQTPIGPEDINEALARYVKEYPEVGMYFGGGVTPTSMPTPETQPMPAPAAKPITLPASAFAGRKSEDELKQIREILSRMEQNQVRGGGLL